MIFILDNQSSKVSPASLADMRVALSVQGAAIAYAWKIQVPRFVLTLGETTVAERQAHGKRCTIVIEDRAADAEGELGDHSIDSQGNPVARVLVDASYEEAKTDDPKIALCPVLSHEAAETMVDDLANAWHMSPRGMLVAREIGDPVQGDWYKGERGCRLSNWVKPDYFNPDCADFKATNYMGTELEPFWVAPLGYILTLRGSEFRPIFGDKVSPARKLRAFAGRMRLRGSEHFFRGFEHDARNELHAQAIGDAS